MKKAIITLTPLKAGIGAEGGKIDVLVEATAPEGALPKDGKGKQRKNVVCVIDASGSMQGKPLAEAKKCAMTVIRKLSPGDVAGVVAYSDEATVVIPAMPVAELLPMLEERISTIATGGYTNLHGGWLLGANQAAVNSGPTALSRVLLLSDGQVNTGEQDPERIKEQCRAMADAGVTTSAYGLGRSFNEDLMGAIAVEGNGGAYYGETAEDLVPNFEAEFLALDATFGKNPGLVSWPGSACLNDLRAHKDAGHLLPPIVEGASSWAVLRFDLPPADEGHFHKLKVAISYEDAEGNKQTAEAEMKLPVLPVPTLSALAADPRVAERVKELEAARIQREAKKAAEKRDWAAVDGFVGEIKAMAAGNAFVEGVAKTLEEIAGARDSVAFGKEAFYAAASMTRSYSTLSAAGASFDAGNLNEASAPAFARRKLRQGKTA